MAHFEGPYVAIPNDNNVGSYLIYRAGRDLPEQLPIGIIPVNRRDLCDVRDTARLFAAAPMLLKALEVMAAAPGLYPDLLVIVQHAIDSATKEKN